MIDRNIAKRIYNTVKDIERSDNRAEITFIDGINKDYIELRIADTDGRRIHCAGFDYTDEDVQQIKDIIESEFITEVFYYGKNMNEDLLAKRIAWFIEKV